MGATGLESDVWITRDGVAVLDHDGVVKVGLRRRAIADVDRHQLPASIPTLEDLYTACGQDFDLSLDLKDARAATAVIAIARAAGAGAIARLWLCHPDWQQVAQWRTLDPDVKLVDSPRWRKIKEGAERRAANLAAAGIDAVNMHASDWTTGRAALFHRFERYCLAWDAQLERVLAELLGHGLDGVYSDYVDRMAEALAIAQR